MKKTSRKRLTLDREVVKALVVHVPGHQLRYVGGGLMNGSNPEYGCNTSTIIDTTSVRPSCRTCEFC
jgi:hypothetical protein